MRFYILGILNEVLSFWLKILNGLTEVLNQTVLEKLTYNPIEY